MRIAASYLDMDAFYASVEQRDQPELRGQPVVIGSSSQRAVVAAASYEARLFRIRSAMPMFRARRLCPDLVILDPRMEHYREISQSIQTILGRYTRLIEPLALDECYLDVSGDTLTVTETRPARASHEGRHPAANGVVSRRATLAEATNEAHAIDLEAQKLLERSEAGTRPVRLLGVGVADLSDRGPTGP